MLVLTVIIAVLNICLGFALAMYLGYGPAGLHETWSILRGNHGQILAEPSTPPLTVNLTPTLDPIAEVQSDPGPEMPAVGEENNLNAEPIRQLDAETYQNQAADSLISILADNWDLNEKYVETSILRLNLTMLKSSMRAGEIDSRLRASQGRCDPDTVESCLKLLREDCTVYLAEQSKTAETFSNRIGELGDMSALGKEIEMANLEQAAQVETTLNNLQYMDLHADPQAVAGRLIEEIKNLRMARDRLRDDHEKAFLTIVRSANRLDNIEKRLSLDAITEMHNRIGLEVELAQWWQEGLHQNHQITAALFDIVHFGAVNDHFGPVAGDRILCELGKFFHNNSGAHDTVGRYAGQQFLVMMIDVGFRAGLKKAEFWRQSLEKAVFLRQGRPIHITFSGAVVEVDPNDTYLMVLERLEKIIKQGKQLEPNRIYFENGKEIEPVDLPHLGVSEEEFII